MMTVSENDQSLATTANIDLRAQLEALESQVTKINSITENK